MAKDLERHPDSREWTEQGPDPEGRGDGRLLFPDGKRYKYPSDYRPSPVDTNTTIDIRIMRDKNLIRPKRKKYVYVFHYRIPPSEEVLKWQCWSDNWKNVKRTFLNIITNGQQIKVCDVKISPFKRHYSSGTNEIQKKDEPEFIPDDRFMERMKAKRLSSFIKREAVKLSKGNDDDAFDLEQVGWISAAEGDSDDIKILEREAFKAMDAARKKMSRQER